MGMFAKRAMRSKSFQKSQLPTPVEPISSVPLEHSAKSVDHLDMRKRMRNVPVENIGLEGHNALDDQELEIKIEQGVQQPGSWKSQVNNAWGGRRNSESKLARRSRSSRVLPDMAQPLAFDPL